MKQARLELRLSQEDKNNLIVKAKNAEKSLSSYCLERLFLKKELSPKDKQTLKDLLLDNKRLGNNLNQLLKNIYINKRIVDQKILQEQTNLIYKNQELLHEIIRRI